MREHWINRLNEITEKYVNAFSGLNLEELNFKPNETTWSIAQCIDHVIVTNEQYFKIIEKVNTGNYQSHWMAKVPFLHGFFGKMILKSVGPETISRKSKTFQVFEPSKSALKANVLDRFKLMQLQLKAYISEINSDKYPKIISSPVSGYVVYSISTAIDIIIAHEERHFLQALNVRSLLNSDS